MNIGLRRLLFISLAILAVLVSVAWSGSADSSSNPTSHTAVAQARTDARAGLHQMISLEDEHIRQLNQKAVAAVDRAEALEYQKQIEAAKLQIEIGAQGHQVELLRSLGRDQAAKGVATKTAVLQSSYQNWAKGLHIQGAEDESKEEQR